MRALSLFLICMFDSIGNGPAWLSMMRVSFARLEPSHLRKDVHFLGHLIVPSPHHDLFSASTPFGAPSPLPHAYYYHHHHHHHHHRLHHLHMKPTVVSPPLEHQSCNQICVEPLTATPFGSPCGCVYPMRIQILLDVASYIVFSLINTLEIEVAAGAYLKQSQVKIMGVNIASQNQEKTIVNIFLVPLGEKFDNTTANLIYDRFKLNKIQLNESLFGLYHVTSISYPGIPSLPRTTYYGSHPIGNPENVPVTSSVDGENRKMGLSIIVLIILASVVLLLVLVVLISIFMRWRKLKRQSSADLLVAASLNKKSGLGSSLSSGNTSSTSASLVSTMAMCMLSVRTFTFMELEKATENFSSTRILGEGGFGRVFHGILEDTTQVAVKFLTRNNHGGDDEFIAEVEMLSRLHHRNLVKLIGICVQGHVRCLVYELVRNGSVESHLHGANKDRPLGWDARLKIALGSARGLAYLHEDSNPRVIHRDFKASNVLLEDDFTPMVSDFGLAKAATEGSRHISTRVMGTFGYVAPEYAMTGHLLVKSDVYSYGVVLLELLSGRKPVDMSQPPGKENLVTWARPLLTSREGLQQLVDPSLAGTYDFNDLAKVAAIASMCVQPEVCDRPFMGEVVQALKLMYNDPYETLAAGCSKTESSSVSNSEFKCHLLHSSCSCKNECCSSPSSPCKLLSPFMTMDYSSGPFALNWWSLPTTRISRSGPLRTTRSKPVLHKLRGSQSEHGELLSRRSLNSLYYWS